MYSITRISKPVVSDTCCFIYNKTTTPEKCHICLLCGHFIWKIVSVLKDASMIESAMYI